MPRPDMMKVLPCVGAALALLTVDLLSREAVLLATPDLCDLLLPNMGLLVGLWRDMQGRKGSKELTFPGEET